jgi:hypothetical protein
MESYYGLDLPFSREVVLPCRYHFPSKGSYRISVKPLVGYSRNMPFSNNAQSWSRPFTDRAAIVSLFYLFQLESGPRSSSSPGGVVGWRGPCCPVQLCSRLRQTSSDPQQLKSGSLPQGHRGRGASISICMYAALNVYLSNGAVAQYLALVRRASLCSSICSVGRGAARNHNVVCSHARSSAHVVS